MCILVTKPYFLLKKKIMLTHDDVMIHFHEHKDANELFTVTHANVYRGERRNKERKKINLPPVFNKLNQSKTQQSSLKYTSKN